MSKEGKNIVTLGKPPKASDLIIYQDGKLLTDFKVEDLPKYRAKRELGKNYTTINQKQDEKSNS